MSLLFPLLLLLSETLTQDCSLNPVSRFYSSAHTDHLYCNTQSNSNSTGGCSSFHRFATEYIVEDDPYFYIYSDLCGMDKTLYAMQFIYQTDEVNSFLTTSEGERDTNIQIYGPDSYHGILGYCSNTNPSDGHHAPLYRLNQVAVNNHLFTIVESEKNNLIGSSSFTYEGIVCYVRTDTFEPTLSPTLATISPTINPSVSPTKSPSKIPSTNPTLYPSISPTTPTNNPTKNPTITPTKSPTKWPTATPTKFPSNNPSKSPTAYPTKYPSFYPTTNPTNNPTADPSTNPTLNPIIPPTINPALESSTHYPTIFPSVEPTLSPVNDGKHAENTENLNENTKNEQLIDNKDYFWILYIVLSCLVCAIIIVIVIYFRIKKVQKGKMMPITTNNSTLSTQNMGSESDNSPEFNTTTQMTKVTSMSDIDGEYINDKVDEELYIDTGNDITKGNEYTKGINHTKTKTNDSTAGNLISDIDNDKVDEELYIDTGYDITKGNETKGINYTNTKTKNNDDTKGDV